MLRKNMFHILFLTVLINHCLYAQTDISVEHSGPTSVRPYSNIDYSVTIRNKGTLDVNNIKLVYTIGSNFSDVSINCINTNGCVLNSNNNVKDTIVIPTLAINEELTLKISGKSGATGVIENKAELILPIEIIDTNLINNTSFTGTLIENTPPVCEPQYAFSLFNSGASPALSTYTRIAPGSYTRNRTTNFKVFTNDGSNAIQITSSSSTTDTQRPLATVSNSVVEVTLGVATPQMSTEASRITQFTFDVPTNKYVFNISDLLRNSAGEYIERVKVTGYDVNNNAIIPTFYNASYSQVVSTNIVRGTASGGRQGAISLYFGTPIKRVVFRQEGTQNYVHYGVSNCILPDIKLTKTGVLNADGTEITYNFKIKNTGKVELNNIAVTDSNIVDKILLSKTSLLPGEETTGSTVYKVTNNDKENGLVSNSAIVTGTPPLGSVVSDISGETYEDDLPSIINIPKVDLSVDLETNLDKPFVGQTVTFTVVARNNGPVDASGVNVVNAIPDGYTIVSVNPSHGNWDGVNWNIGNLLNLESATLQVVAIVKPEGYYNSSATISGNQFDFNLQNNIGSVELIPQYCPSPGKCISLKVSRLK